MSFGENLAKFFGGSRKSSTQNKAWKEKKTGLNGLDPFYDAVDAGQLGTYDTKENRKRSRLEIMTIWDSMQRDPTISSALSLHITAALGGHETRGDVVFLTPKTELKQDSKKNAALIKMVEEEAKNLMPMINKMAFSFTREALCFGDSYARIYGKEGKGIVQILSNELTEAPLIQSFEKGGNTVGFHVLEIDGSQTRTTIKLDTTQMLRMKMPRTSHVKQYKVGDMIRRKTLGEDDIEKLPIIEADVGGSLLCDAETTWANIQLLLQALNSQQIADSVEQAFLTVDVQSMPEEQRQKYKAGIQKMLQKHRDNVKSALQGGDALWSKSWHVLPVWGDKQVLNAVGDLSRRGVPINTEALVFNLRRLCALLGMDMAMLGWAEQLSGGLGDGGFFHTSAQISQKSIHIRTSFSEFLNELINLHIGYKYGKVFDLNNLPWQIEFYSDMSAAATEALQNKQTRANTLAVIASCLAGLKDLSLSKESAFLLLTKTGGFDDEEASQLVEDLARQADKERIEGEPIEPEGEEE